MTKPEIFALPGTGSIRFALTFKELTLTTFYGDAICFEAYGFNAYSLDVLKKNDGTRGSQRGTLGPLSR
jgi:hypothetical protein